MATIKDVKFKRTSVPGKVPTTTDIGVGELAINLVDKKLYTANTTAVFELGANSTNLNVSNVATINAISANGSVGLAGQGLTSNGTSIYWSDNPGYTGSQGVTGYVGSAGADGTIGTDGYTGSMGYTGSQGDIGYTGSAGADGTIGIDGYTGSMGYTGSAGADGVIGIDGYTGSMGYTGSAGADGVIGYNGSNGYTGSQGTTGYTGSKGTDGVIGYNGSTGYTGSQGSLGYAGSQGVGYAGSQGTIGYAGSQGTIGYTGSIGSLGYTGSQGDAGVSAAGRHYYNNSVASDISGYETWTTTPSPLTEETMSATANSSSGWVSIVSFATASGDPNVTSIPVGQMTWHQWQHVNDTSGISKFRYRLYKRSDPGGTETMLLEFESGEINNTTSAEYTYEQFIQTPIALDLTDRLVTEVYFSTTSTTDVIGSITHDGPTRQSYVITPISQGVTGYDGSRGYTGSQGIAGYTGSIGNIGYTGSQGTIGYTGSLGYAGSQGTIGYTGSLGYAGSQGVIGYTGSQGVIGYTGSFGYAGSQGVIGYTGSASTVVGYTGSEGYTGSAGAGYTGSASTVVGYTGSLGYTGSAGAGYTGSQGAPGSGSGGANIRYVTTNTTITDNDDLIVTDGTMTIYLQVGVEGRKVSFKNINNGTVTILANGSQTIDGYANVIMAEINTSFGVSFANTSWLIF